MIPSCSLAFVAGRVVTRWSDQRWVSRNPLWAIAAGTCANIAALRFL